jgi:hypothetical protein
MNHGPYSLEEALETWAHYDADAPAQKRNPDTGAFLPSPDSRNSPSEIVYTLWDEESPEVRNEKEKQLLLALRKGDAIAEGELVSPEHDKELAPIPRVFWDFLCIDIEKGAASGDGRRYGNIQVFVGRGGKLARSASRGPRDPKGEKIKVLFEKFVADHDHSSELPSLSAVAEVIGEMAKQTYGDVRGFSPSNIKKHISSKFKLLKNN